MYSSPAPSAPLQFKYVGVCLLGEFRVVLSTVQLPPTPFASFTYLIHCLGCFIWSSFCSRLSQQPRQSGSRMNLSRRSLTTQLQSAAGVKSPGDGWAVGKKLTVKKRSTEQDFWNPSPAFIDLKRGLTGQRGSDHFHQGPSDAGLAAVLLCPDVSLLRPRAPPPIPTRTRTRGFLAAGMQPPPHSARPRPSAVPGQGFATHVLLHFSQVLLGEGRRSGLHGEGGRWRFFRVRELGLRRPAQAGGFGLQMKGQRGRRRGSGGRGLRLRKQRDSWVKL